MNVVMVGQFWFPRGSANAARIRNLALGLRERGARVHVITMVPRPATKSGGSSNGGGEYLGISYESGWRDRDRTVPLLRGQLGDKLRWFVGLYAATLFATRRLRERIDRHACDLVFVYDRSALRMTPLVRLCRKRQVPCVLDVTETSEQFGRRLSPLYWDVALGARLTPRLFDGLTVITTGLETFYRGLGCARSRSGHPPPRRGRPATRSSGSPTWARCCPATPRRCCSRPCAWWRAGDCGCRCT